MPYKDKEKDIRCKAQWQKENAIIHRKAVLAYAKRNPEKERNRKAKWLAANPEKRLLQRAKARAKKDRLEFSIDLSDIVIPSTCPVFGTPIHRPSIDRIDSTKGYVKGNVWVISWRANRIKNDATLDELERLVAAIKKLQGENV